MDRRTRSVRQPGFTLVELLVVIAIIGVLVGLLLPAVQAAREAARRMSCSNNLKNIGLALHNYHDTYNKFPDGHQFRGDFDGIPTDGAGGSGYGWGWSILPFLEQANLFEQFDSRFPVMEKTITQNGILAATPLDIFSCPSDPKPDAFNDGQIQPSATSSYQGASGGYDSYPSNAPTAAANTLRFNGMFQRNNRGPYGFRDMTDGTSNTIVVAETKWEMDANSRNRSRIYGASDNIVFATGATNALLVCGQWAMNWTATEGNGQPHRTAGSTHPGGAQFLLGDGSVRFIQETVQHTAHVWIDNPNAFDRLNKGVGYGVYQRLYSVNDGLTLGEY